MIAMTQVVMGPVLRLYNGKNTRIKYSHQTCRMLIQAAVLLPQDVATVFKCSPQSQVPSCRLSVVGKCDEKFKRDVMHLLTGVLRH